MNDMDFTNPWIPAGTVATLVAMWRGWRRLKAENREDRQHEVMDEAGTSLIEHLHEEIKRLTEQQKALTERVDLMAKERNVALIDNAKLSESLKSLGEKVSQLEGEVARVESERDAVRSDLVETKEAYRKLIEAQSSPDSPRRRMADRAAIDDLDVHKI